MVALPSFNYYLGVKFTLALKATPATTKTVYCVNHCNMDADAGEYATVYWPILLGLPELGAEAGTFVPYLSGGTITLDNTRGSFGFNRKFSDLLENYAIIGQPVVIYLYDTYLNTRDFGGFSAGDLVWQGKVESVSGLDELSIDVAADLIPDRKTCLQITSDITQFADAPASSLGKYLPIVAGGEVILPAYKITADGESATASYVTSTTLSNVYSSPHVIGTGDIWLYTYDIDSLPVGITNLDPTTTIGSGPNSAYSFDASGGTYQQIYEIMEGETGVYAGAGVELYLKANGTGATASTCYLYVSLFEVDATKDSVNREIAKGTIDLSDYDTENNAGGYFYALCTWDRPAILDFNSYDYAIGVKQSGWAANESSWANDSGVTVKRWLADDSAESASGFTLQIDGRASTYDTPMMRLGWISISAQSITTANKNGLSSYYTTLTAGSHSIDWNKLNLFLITQGLLDDSSGTITGTPYTSLVRPDHFIEAITSTWNGTTWSSSGDWDFSTYSAYYSARYAASGTRTRQLSGWMDGDVTLSDALEAICRDTASRIGIDNENKLFLWPWGSAYSIQTTLTPNELTPESYYIGDPTTVVNQVSFSYKKTSLNLDVSRNMPNAQSSNYSYTISWNEDTDSRTAYLSADSDTLYGARPLALGETDWIGSTTSAETLAEFYLATFAAPSEFASILSPFDIAGAQKMFRVIRISHPELPAFGGTNPEDREPVEEGSGCKYANLKGGREWYRCKTYRVFIEGRYLILPINGAPVVRLKVRILNNRPKDPT